MPRSAWQKAAANGCFCGGRAFGYLCSFVIISDAGDFSTSLEMTSCSFGLRRDEGVPPYRGSVTPAKEIIVHRQNTCGRTRASAPTTLYQSLNLLLHNAISTEALAEWRNPPRKKYKVPFTYVRVRSRLGLDYARDDGAIYRSIWFYNVILSVRASPTCPQGFPAGGFWFFFFA